MKYQPAAADLLLAYRGHFSTLQHCTYLISNSLGAMPKTAPQRLQEFTDLWAHRGVRAWDDAWWELAKVKGDEIAAFLGGKGGELSIQPNVSTAISVFLSCLNFSGKRNRIVLSALDFPTDIYVCTVFGKALGAEPVVVQQQNEVYGGTEQLLAAIDNRTALVCISHVLYKSGAITDVKRICEKAHHYGALVLLDTYHSAGILPVDLKKLNVDAATGGVLKWLCGGPGTIYLWISPRHKKQFTPKLTGWLAHKDPFRFSTEMDYTEGAYRFLAGTPPIAPLYYATEGIKLLHEIGMDNVRNKSVRQTGTVIERALADGLSVNTPLEDNLRGGAVTINLPDAYGIAKELLHRNYIIDYREGAGIRVAPHFYTSDAEIDAFFDEIRVIRADQSFRRHKRKRGKVS